MFQMFKSRAAKLAVDKGQETLREFNELVPTLRALGLGLSDVSLKLGRPSGISASLSGSVDALVDADVIQELIDRHKDNQTLTIVLEGLIAAAQFKAQLVDLGFKGLKLDVRLGMFPSVKLGLLPTVTPDAATAALAYRI